MIDVIHVGFPKCASTFIQESVLPSIEDLNYIDLHPVIEYFHSDDAFFDEGVFADAIGQQVQKGKRNVISSEYIINYFRHWSRSLERLAALYPRARILIVIRNQTDFFASYYQEKIRGGGGYFFDRFVKSYCKKNGALDACKYIQILEKLCQTFPEVRIELYENMFKDSKLTDLCEFLGSEHTYKSAATKVNSKYSPVSHHISLLINKFQPTKQQGFSNYMSQEYYGLLAPSVDKAVEKLFPEWRIEIAEESKEFIKEFYSVSNEELQRFFSEDIRELGYYF